MYDSRFAVRSIQESLDRAGILVEIDGILGHRTKQALYNLDPSKLLVVEFDLLMEYGMSLDELLVGPGFKTPGYKYLSVAHTENYVDLVCKTVGVSDLANIVKILISYEAVIVKVDGVLCYDVLSTNGSSRGLTQFQPGAWADAAKHLRGIDKTLDPGVYRDRVYFPVYNILACVGYVLINASILRSKGISVNAETIYLTHNQGAGFWDGRRTNVRGQSTKVQRLIQKYSN